MSLLVNNYGPGARPILNELHWLPVAKQLEVRDTLMAFKCIKGLAPPSLCNEFTTSRQVHTRYTRNIDKRNVPFHLDQQR